MVIIIPSFTEPIAPRMDGKKGEKTGWWRQESGGAADDAITDGMSRKGLFFARLPHAESNHAICFACALALWLLSVQCVSVYGPYFIAHKAASGRYTLLLQLSNNLCYFVWVVHRMYVYMSEKKKKEDRVHRTEFYTVSAVLIWNASRISHQ